MQAKNTTRTDLQRLWNIRWKARTDRIWFCNNILGYPDLNAEVHGKIEPYLMMFPKPSFEEARASDLVLDNGKFQYTPWLDPYKAPGPRRVLILDPRSSMKCVKNALLSMSSGEYKKPEDLRIGDELKSITDDFATTTCIVTGIEKQSSQPCYRITFRSGRVLEVSNNHPLRKLDSWVFAEDLRVGDRIVAIHAAKWDFVKKLEPIGEHETWAIETSDGILVCDDIVTHNTTFNTISDTLFWIINFPHLCYATIFSVGEKAQDVIKNSLEYHFKFNRRFREVFPDLVPHRRIADWGTSEDFTVEGRNEIFERLKKPPRVEPTVKSLSLDKTGTGYHFDVIKCSDIVEPSNIRTPSERENVKMRVGLLPKILVVPEGWLYLEGTFYHPADLYSDMVRSYLEKPPEDRNWKIFLRSAYVRDTGTAPVSLTPDDLKYREFKRDAEGHEVSFWPSRFPWKELNRIKNDPIEGGANFAAQYLLDLNADIGSERPFADPITWISRSDFQRVPVDFRLVTVDLADTVAAKSNPSVFVVAAFDRVGRCYVEKIVRGKFQANEILDILYQLNGEFRPRHIFIEEYSYVTGLKSGIQARSESSSIWPPFFFHKRRHKANDKHERIIRALQPPFKSGDLKFVNPLVAGSDTRNAPDDLVQANREITVALESEFREATVVSLGNTDDILDALADLYLCREYFGPGFGDSDAVPTAAVLAENWRKQHETAFKEMVFGKTEPDPRVLVEW